MWLNIVGGKMIVGSVTWYTDYILLFLNTRQALHRNPTCLSISVQVPLHQTVPYSQQQHFWLHVELFSLKFCPRRFYVKFDTHIMRHMHRRPRVVMIPLCLQLTVTIQLASWQLSFFRVYRQYISWIILMPCAVPCGLVATNLAFLELPKLL